MDIKPFKAYLPDVAVAAQTVSKPFDFYTHDELDAILHANPHSFLNIVKPDYNSAEKAPVNSEELFEKSRAKFLSFVGREIYHLHNTTAYYIYRQTSSRGSNTGLIVAAAVSDYKAGKIKIHEQTIERKEVVLKNYLRSVKINAEPILLTYPKSDTISDKISTITSTQKPTYTITIEGTDHILWLVDGEDDKAFFTLSFGQLKEVFVADGHHRLASSALLYEEFAAANPGSDKLPTYGHFMAALYADDQIGLYEFNRLVKDLNNLSDEQFIEKLKENFLVVLHSNNAVKPTLPHHFTMYLSGCWYYLTLNTEAQEKYLGDNPLDADLLTELILTPLLGIGDLRTDKRIGFTSGVQGLQAVAHRVNTGKFKAAFVLHPVQFDQFYSISLAGKTMPPKSTWFEPKLLNGLVIYSYE